jgi:hypothetical protein
MDAATIEALIKVRAENLELFTDLRNGIDRVALAQAAQTATTNANTAAQAANTAGLFAGVTGMQVLVVVAIAATLALTPFVLLVGASAVVLAGFAIGIMGTVAALGLFIIPLVAVGGIMFALTQHFANVNNSVAMLTDSVTKMAAALTVQAKPAVDAMLQNLITWVPTIQALASAAIGFFNDRLPALLSIANNAMVIVVNTLYGLGQGFSYFADNMIKMAPQIQSVLMLLGGQAGAAFQVLVGVLLQVTQWFVERAPAMIPIVAQILQFLGGVVVFLAQAFGKLVDYIIATWPAIVKSAQDYWAAIMDLWKAIDTNLMPTFRTFISDVLPKAIATVQDLAKQKQGLKVIIETVVAVLLLMVAGLVTLIATSLQVIDAIAKFFNWLVWLGDQIPKLQTPLINFGNWVKDNIIKPIQDVVYWAGQAADTLGKAFSGGGVANAPGGKFGARAGGGQVLSGSSYLVGENGPELLRMGPTGGTVVPNNRLSSGSGTGMGSDRDVLMAILKALTGPSAPRTGIEAALAQAMEKATYNRSLGLTSGY